MSGINASISLYDSASVTLQTIYNSTVRAMGGFENMTNAINSIPNPSLEWESINLSDRFYQEVQKIDALAGNISTLQDEISANAYGMEILPENAIYDIANVSDKVSLLSQQIKMLETIDISGRSEDEVSSINQQLQMSQTLLSNIHSTQQRINTGLSDNNIQAVNQGFSQLNTLANNLEKSIIKTMSNFGALNTETVEIAGGANRANAEILEIAENADRANNSMEELAENSEEIGHALEDADNSLNSLNDSISKGFNMLKSMAGIKIAFDVGKKAIGLSDELTQVDARLNLVVDDGGSIDELQQKIYQSAQRSRADYMTTANTVAGLAQRAGGAFSSNDEVIKFAENLNKQFVIAGASQQDISSASLQLTQALGSGVLRGEELNAVFEAAPNIIENIANYMGVPVGSIREMASEGRISADIVKNAMLSATESINEQFESMPMTWSQRLVMFKNNAVMAFQPVLNKINEVANSEKFTALIDKATIVTAQLAGVAVEAFEKIITLGDIIYYTWDTVGPLVAGVAVAMGLYVGALKIYNIVTAVSKILQNDFNTALLACPLVWIVGAIIAVIALVYAVTAAMNKWRGTTVSAAGVIIGSFAFVGAFIYNTFIGIINGIIQFLFSGFVVPIIGVFEWIINVFGGGFDSFGAAVANLLGQIIGWFLSLGKVVTTIIDSIFGTDWTSGLEALRSEVVEWGKNENAFTVSEDFYKGNIINRIEYTSAYDKGYKLGDNIEDKLSNFGLDNINNLLNDEMPEGLGVDVPTYDQISGISDDTSEIADNLSSEDLQWLYDIAEREAINKFTTAEVKVEMGGVTNHLSSDMDIDGFVNKLTSKVEEALIISAEGVHA